jgi:hypothetical protein
MYPSSRPMWHPVNSLRTHFLHLSLYLSCIPKSNLYKRPLVHTCERECVKKCARRIVSDIISILADPALPNLIIPRNASAPQFPDDPSNLPCTSLYFSSLSRATNDTSSHPIAPLRFLPRPHFPTTLPSTSTRFTKYVLIEMPSAQLLETRNVSFPSQAQVHYLTPLPRHQFPIIDVKRLAPDCPIRTKPCESKHDT